MRSADPARGQQYQNAGTQKNARPDHRPVFRYPWQANGPAPISQQHILEREIATDGKQQRQQDGVENAIALSPRRIKRADTAPAEIDHERRRQKQQPDASEHPYIFSAQRIVHANGG